MTGHLPKVANLISPVLCRRNCGEAAGAPEPQLIAPVRPFSNDTWKDCQSTGIPATLWPAEAHALTLH